MPSVWMVLKTSDMIGLYRTARAKFNKIEIALRTLGSTGCQPVLFGSLPKSSLNVRRQSFCNALMSSASCQRLQAASLRSPETKLIVLRP
jgi:hypothetical protein